MDSNNSAEIANYKNHLNISGYSDKTQSQYLLYLNDLLKFINKDLNTITTEDITSYLSHKKDAGIRNTSLNAIYASIKYYFDNYKKLHLMENIRTPKKEKYLPTVLTKDEVKRLFEVIEDKKDKLILELLYSSGLRVSELCNLKKNSIDFSEAIIRITGGKGNKDRIVIVSKKWLIEYQVFATKFFKKTDSEYVFCKKNGTNYSSDTIQKMIKNYADKAKINKKVTPHTLRHSFATHLLDAGENIRKIQELLGHSNLSTTQIYTKVTTDELKKVRSPLDNMK
ncbi:MAG: tyrosine-type recombinase/integrase [Candidatus ainarchaeum sp.]|nr:tyrosine-type recombinase/integrase [Candidatus ainarchaeum sp.]